MKKKGLIVVSIVLTGILIGSVFLFKSLIKESSRSSKPATATLEQLLSLPYVAYTETAQDIEKTGVIIYNPNKTWDGYNLVGNDLLAMDGTPIKSLPPSILNIMTKEAHFLSILNQSLCLFDWELDKAWEKDLLLHHEISLTSKSTILTTTKEVQTYNNRLVEFDVILELDHDGNELQRWSTWEQFEKLKRIHKPLPLDLPGELNTGSNPIGAAKSRRFGGDYDYYHLNSIQELPENPKFAMDGRFRAGNWLVILRNVNLIIILDQETKEIIWSFGVDELDQPHHARMLATGNILLFDNGPYRGYTRVIEIDPLTNKIEWEYRGDPPESFDSEWLGSAQRLPNGNTLIGDGWNGRAIEVTKQGEVVWEWLNPKFNSEGKRKNFYRIIRYSKESVELH
jgi:hypothetical protein